MNSLYLVFEITADGSRVWRGSFIHESDTEFIRHCEDWLSTEMVVDKYVATSHGIDMDNYRLFLRHAEPKFILSKTYVVVDER